MEENNGMTKEVAINQWRLKMDKKYKIAKAINILLCISMVVTIMLCVYDAWSLNGEYTLFSFFASLAIHGGLGIMMYCGIDWILRKVFNR